MTVVNVVFKQFVIVVDSYAATDPFWPRTIFPSCAVICVISLANVNQV